MMMKNTINNIILLHKTMIITTTKRRLINISSIYKRSFSLNPIESNNDITSIPIESSSFSIKGKSLDGRAAYLDFQATTPM